MHEIKMNTAVTAFSTKRIAYTHYARTLAYYKKFHNR